MNFTLREVDSHTTSSAAARTHPWRVLIAEDEALPADLLKRMLIRLGHLVVGTAQNGLEALQLARETTPDVVIMDLRMPVMDGWTAMAELTRNMFMPIVVVSALDDRESLEQAVIGGASGFLTKPVREDDLERALELAIARCADLKEIRQLRAEAEYRAQQQAAQLQELEHALGALRDAQLQLASAARRAAVTSLAHGLAHEINNALTPIIGNAQLIALLHATEAETVDRTTQIIQHAQRIAGWTASFRQVTTGGKREPMDFSWNQIVRETFALYRDRFQRLSITSHIDLDEQCPAMQGHPDQIQEALMMLLQNAVEAMPGGGEIEFASTYDGSQNAVTAHLSDTGVGILPEHLPLVFDAGFTTKNTASSASLGWGLFTARQIVQAHHGEIQIASPAAGRTRGTTVSLFLPLHLPSEV